MKNIHWGTLVIGAALGYLVLPPILGMIIPHPTMPKNPPAQ